MSGIGVGRRCGGSLAPLLSNASAGGPQKRKNRRRTGGLASLKAELAASYNDRPEQKSRAKKINRIKLPAKS
jgi:hypothetical protein